MRLKGYGGPAQPSPLRGGTLNAVYRNLEVKCVGCGTHNTVEPTITRRPKRRSGNRKSAFAASHARSNAAIPTNAAIWCGCDVAIKRLVIVLFVGVIVGLGFLVTNSSPKTAAPDRAGLFVAQF